MTSSPMAPGGAWWRRMVCCLPSNPTTANWFQSRAAVAFTACSIYPAFRDISFRPPPFPRKVMNGDSYTDVDLAELVANHRRAKADASVVVVPADGRGDCGSVQLDGSGKLASFEEKQGPFHSPHANAGIYILSREMLYLTPTDVEISLERELLPEERRSRCKCFSMRGANNESHDYRSCRLHRQISGEAVSGNGLFGAWIWLQRTRRCMSVSKVAQDLLAAQYFAHTQSQPYGFASSTLLGR